MVRVPGGVGVIIKMMKLVMRRSSTEVKTGFEFILFPTDVKKVETS